VLSSDQCSALRQLLKEYSTPFYLFSERRIRDNVRQLEQAFNKLPVPVQIAYSYKTNSLSGICSLMNQLGCWAEVTSEFELSLAKRVKATKIIFNGIHKTVDELGEAIRSGSLVNLDGFIQIEKYLQISSKYPSHQGEIGIRVSPRPGGLSNWDKFGIEGDAQTILDYIPQHLRNSVVALHCHVGTNIEDPAVYFQTTRDLIHLKVALNKHGCKIKYLDIGGGFPSARSEQEFTKYAAAVGEAIAEERELDYSIIIEPGRALIENSGIVVSQVVDVRTHTNASHPYVIIDVGVNLVMGTDFVGNRNLIVFQKEHLPSDTIYNVFGNLCAQNDLFADKIQLPPIQIGDYIVILDCGAYDLSTAYPFIRLRPEVYLHTTRNDIILMRRREMLEDVLSLEPNHKMT
jgi:diaminopimelate decarboxylase